MRYNSVKDTQKDYRAILGNGAYAVSPAPLFRDGEH